MTDREARHCWGFVPRSSAWVSNTALRRSLIRGLRQIEETQRTSSCSRAISYLLARNLRRKLATVLGESIPKVR